LMLASTMQFSRYGRPRDKTRRIHGGQSTVQKRMPQRPVPSGPNSVPGHLPAAASVSVPRRRRTSWPCRRAGRITSAPQ
jgi:hypothetical protein